jgi:hypothetical protein
LLLVFGITIAQAQQEDYKKQEEKGAPKSQNEFEYNSDNSGKKWDWADARMGGNFGMSFQNGGLFIDASPTFGYRINKVVELGAGFKTLYYRQRNVNFDNSSNTFVYTSLTYGPLAYGRFTVWDGIFAMAQYEMANKNPFHITSFDQLNDRINVHHLLIGGGYSTPIGGAGNLNISLLYDVIDDKESIYQFGTFGNFPLLLNVNVGFGINRR